MPDSVIDDVDARPAELVERDELRAGEPAVAVEARRGAQQRQRLGDRPALGLQIVGAPQHDRDRLGQRVAVGRVAGEQPLGLARAVLHREGAGDAERIEAVQVAAGRQDRRACAAGRRPAPGG